MRHQYFSMDARDDVQRALRQGAYHSLKACSEPARDTFLLTVWRAHRWTIVGVGLFLLIELVGLAGLVVGGMNRF